ncbi:hypothetical protein THAOC_18541 [Thalassiosira oceanica]|uniref:Uncharacterized protein n=1 Tax=Thalassiosira oceanica TaxID=159749 RepID=K0SRR7_THAOC|nr:hypothetical protein THAOC_18541 [Thalassiosira oceanica]|eukprot:EJK61027.1 hypothetical protein THAOC_18541 [Thalassiosira oceanica]
MLKGFRNEDPATVKTLSIEVDVPELLVKCAAKAGATAQEKRVADLTLLAFYYLLRVGEYTSRYRNSKSKEKTKRGRPGKKKRNKKTVNFRVSDVKFFKKDGGGRLRQLPPDASAVDIMSADSATLLLTDGSEKWLEERLHTPTDYQACKTLSGASPGPHHRGHSFVHNFKHRVAVRLPGKERNPTRHSKGRQPRP